MKEITIVTAFFSLSRESWKGFERDDEKYFQQFEFWAGIKNKVIIYVGNEEHYVKAVEIREKYGLKDKTECIIIDNIFEKDIELYNSINKAAKQPDIADYRLKPNNPEAWNGDYNYIMLMKEWCLYDAVKRGLATGMLAWLDFGFNKSVGGGGEVYVDKKDFDFLWRYDFKDKIILFPLTVLKDHPPIYQIIRDMTTFIQGCMFVVPDFLCARLWQLVRENMLSMNKLGLMDDDQTILLMSYEEEPDIFQLIPCGWCLGLKVCGGKHMKIRELDKNIKKSIYSELKRVVSNKIYSLSCKKNKKKELMRYLHKQKKSIIQNELKGYK